MIQKKLAAKFRWLRVFYYQKVTPTPSDSE